MLACLRDACDAPRAIHGGIGGSGMIGAFGHRAINRHQRASASNARSCGARCCSCSAAALARARRRTPISASAPRSRASRRTSAIGCLGSRARSIAHARPGAGDRKRIVGCRAGAYVSPAYTSHSCNTCAALVRRLRGPFPVVSLSKRSRISVAARSASGSLHRPRRLAPRSMVHSLHICVCRERDRRRSGGPAIASVGRTHRRRGQENENRPNRNVSCCKNESPTCP